jgi:protein-tyrosine phosphatase
LSSVLFVCLGNICRSPLAEGMMRHLCAQAGHEMRIDSAGTGGWHAGGPPDERAIAAALHAGFDISRQRARQLTPDDFSMFDYILAMDRSNLAMVQALKPDDCLAQLSLLLDFASGSTKGQPVPDPYYGNARDFDKTVALVRTGCAGFLAHLKG